MILGFSLLLALGYAASPDPEILFSFFFSDEDCKWVALIEPRCLSMGIFVCRRRNFATPDSRLLFVFGELPYFSSASALFNRARNRRQVDIRRARFERFQADVPATLHRCEKCGITEMSNSDADFRVTDDGHEFCTAHLPQN